MKVSVIFFDNTYYNIYHKVDLVQTIPNYDNISPNIVVKSSILFKDNEIGWA